MRSRMERQRRSPPAAVPEGLVLKVLRTAVAALLRFLVQLQRRRVDAVAQPGRAGAVVEHVAQVRAAAAAPDFGADGVVAGVDLRLPPLRGGGGVEAGPAAVCVELGLGAEQLLA